MPTLDPQKQREFAVEVVRQLRDHGFQAYWAGGCVRDHLLGRAAKDYDVATSAHPEEITAVFRHRKTLAIGAAFGVMTVLGPRGAGQIEVATFRQDVSYSDGRHPDRIAFSSPEEDAQRRDFTINGIFYDPLAEQVIDFVNGQTDLQQGLIRAIGNAQARFTEDKLRMLRAVRFAAKFNFRLEQSTFDAMCEMASQITVVSAERIADEMRAILVHPSRVRAMRILHAAGLLTVILPQAAEVAKRENWPSDLAIELNSEPEASSNLPLTLNLLQAVDEPSFSLALAILLHALPADGIAGAVARAWKISRQEAEQLTWLLEHQKSLAHARELRWSQLQPLLLAPDAEDLLKLHAAQAAVGLIDPKQVAYCRAQLAQPAAELNPDPFITGEDLLALGIRPGPIFAHLLKSVREAQLDGVVRDRAAALEWIQHMQSEKND
jgi:poly(A) polymerase